MDTREVQVRQTWSLQPVGDFLSGFAPTELVVPEGHRIR